MAYFTPNIQNTSNCKKSLPKRRLPKEELSISYHIFQNYHSWKRFSFPFHPCSPVLCSWVTAANANKGQLPTMRSIMNSFSKIPMNTPLMFQELKSSKQPPFEDHSCWNMQNLNENGTKQMETLLKVNIFPLMYQ